MDDIYECVHSPFGCFRCVIEREKELDREVERQRGGMWFQVFTILADA